MLACLTLRSDACARGYSVLMADYTKLNLKQDVEDMAPKFQLSPGLESRFARKALELENSGVSYYKIAPEFRTPFGHRHGEQEEIYIVVGGSARLKLDDDVVDSRMGRGPDPGSRDARARGRPRRRRGDRVRRPEHRQQGHRDGAGLVERLTECPPVLAREWPLAARRRRLPLIEALHSPHDDTDAVFRAHDSESLWP